MSLSERYAQNADWFWASVLIWIPVTIWVLAFISWMVMGEIDFLTGFLGLCVALGLGAFSFFPPARWVPLALLALMSLITMAFPACQGALNKRALDQIEIEQAEKAYMNAVSSPQGAGAAFRLARYLFDRGLVCQAVALLEIHLENANKRVYFEEFKLLAAWKPLAESGRYPAELRCFKCGRVNSPRAMVCFQCRAPYLKGHIRRGWGMAANSGKMIAVVLLLVMLLVSVPLSATALPPGLGIVAVLVQIVLGGWIAFRALST